ncbi:MAG: HAD-IIA family hydrolase [Anaerolineaceae bacterium]|nr:HAD-IIA family hydrolase [Anaerolineaceae bacterium]
MSHEPLTQVRCFLLDMDGTFYLGERLLQGALEFIETLRAQGKEFVFLTNNSSKHRRQYAEKITRLGVPIPSDKVFTSGEATALHLKRTHPGGRMYLVGTPALEEEFHNLGFQLVEDEPELVVLGFDTTLTYNKLWKLCDYVRAGLPYIATHPDLNCPIDNGFMPDIGAMIAFVAASTGRNPDLVVGKPNRLIIDTLAQKIGFAVKDMAMVGDRLYTDIALGETSGIMTVLVLSGETRRAQLAASPHQPDYVFENLKALSDWLIENNG